MEKMERRKGITLFVAILLAACATNSALEEAPNVIPRDVLDSFCSWLITQHGLDSGPEIMVWRETRPAIDVFLLHLLVAGDVLTPEDANRDDQYSKELRDSFQPIAVVVPKHSSLCHWKGRDFDSGERGEMRLILALSGPLENPYAADRREEIGIIARLSSGPLGGDWYWIALQRTDGGGWRADDIFPLDISEN
ncbi:MAG: hypothetical protein GY856_43340 [bacterium]|nr:hypothetical protein [bacterium]